MTWKTHIIGGMQAGILFAFATGADPKTAAIEIGASTIGSILPDIDQPNSKISRSDLLLSGISMILSRITKHRREVHTVWASFLFALLSCIFLFMSSFTTSSGMSFAMGLLIAIAIDTMGGKIGSIIGLFFFFFSPKYLDTNTPILNTKLIIPCAIAVFIGCISHLVYDSANVQGIMWLHPLSKKRYHYLNIQTQSREETIFAFVMGAVLAFMLLVFNPFGTQNLSEIYRLLLL